MLINSLPARNRSIQPGSSLDSRLVQVHFPGRLLKLLLLAAVLLVGASECLAFKRAPDRMGILPLQAIGVDLESALAVESLLKVELQKEFSEGVVLGGDALDLGDDDPCAEVDCAIRVGRLNDLDLVVICMISRLGGKIVVQYNLVDVHGKSVLIADNTTAASLEDLDMVMRRVALSLSRRKGIDDIGEVGAIMEGEAVSSRRRSGHKVAGVSLGYSYPRSGFDEQDRFLSFALRRGFETEHLSAGFEMAAHRGLAATIYSHYLASKSDICPYVGGGLGFHWVYHKDKLPDKREDGFHVNLSGGLRLYRTYDFQLVLGVGYIFTFNNYDDRAMMFSLGILK